MTTMCRICLVVLWAATSLAAQSNPVPFVDQPLLPVSAAPGGAGFTLTINGAGFVSGSVVNWSGVPLPTTFVSSARLTATVAASNVATPMTAAVTVVNPTPGGGISNFALFPVAKPIPNLQFAVKGSAIANVFGEVVSDFNGDGKLDLAIATSSPNVVRIFLGRGDGTFQSPVLYPFSGITGNGIFVGDFNRDGKVDLIVAQSLLLGNGDGTFQPAMNLGTLLTGVSAIGDFNQDGKLDVAGAVISAPLSGYVYLALGNGDGTFQPSTSVGVCNGNESAAMAALDLNGDGKLDLVNIDYKGGLCVLLGNGDGTFVQPTGEPGLEISTFSFADFNADNQQDLLYTTPNPVMALGNGDGTFQSAFPLSTCPQTAQIGSMTPGDFNVDGKLDFAMSTCLWLGNGDGTFQTPIPYLPLGAISPDVVGDFNGDGRLDLEGSGVVALQVVEDFSLIAASPSQTVTPGQTANYSLTVTPINNFNQTVSFTCSGAPSGSTCTVTPSSLTLDGSNSATASVAVVTAASAMGVIEPERAGFPKSMFATWVTMTGMFGLSGFLFIGGTRRGSRSRPFHRCALLGALCLSATIWGCGSGNNGGSGTSTGSYQLTVTGTYTAGSATLAHSANLTLVVQ